MALVLKDRVKGWTDSYGEDNFVIFATTNGYQSFSVIGNGNQTYYTVFDPTNYDWEVGIGTYTAATTTLSRDTILSSSNNNLIVSFLPGTKELFVGYPAEKAVTLDTPQTITDKTFVNATVTSGTINNTTIGATTPASGVFTTLVASGASLTSVNAGVALLTSATVTTLNATSVSIASANVGNLQGVGASIGSINAGVAVVTNLTATGASVASINAGVALFTNATTTTLNATGASIASANIGNLQFTAASIASINAGVAVITNLTATGASIASANVGNAVITAATVTGASIASANLGTAVITTGTVTNLTATSASVASANAAVALVTTGTVTNLTSTGASIASANLGTAVITGLTATGASIASANIGNASITTLSFTNASITSANIGTAVITTLTATGASIASANAGTAVITNLTVTGASIASVNAGVAVLAAGTAALPSLTTTGDTNTGVFFPAADTVGVTTGGSERLRVDSSGNVGIGSTSPGVRLEVSAAQGPIIRLNNTTAAGTAGNAAYSILNCPSGSGAFYRAHLATSDNGSSYDWGIGNFGTSTKDVLAFYSGGLTERMRIDSSGNVGIGGTANAYEKVQLGGTLPTSGNISVGLVNRGTVPSGSTTAAYGIVNGVYTAASAFTVANYYQFYAHDVTKGAGSAITSNYGFYCDALTFGTNNYGFYSNIASGSNRWNFYAAGTASNYFAGSVYFGATTGTAPTLYYSTDSSGGYFTKNSNSTGATTAYDFLINGTRVGSITTSGSATAYNTSSDYRLKENVQPMTNALQKIAALKPCTYTWKSSGEAGEGFIAHELAEVFPQAVTGEKDAVDADGKISPQGVDTSFLVATLAAAIQELKAENDALKARIEALEAK